MKSPQTRYRIFGREAYETPLQQVATLEAPEGNAAIFELKNKLPDRPWVELVAIPEQAVTVVIAEGEIK